MGRHDPALGVADRRYERRLLAAWERFVDGAGLASGVVPDVVGQSWMRCRSAHIDPALEHAPDPLAEPDLMALRQRHRELIEASRPVMMQAHDLLSESATMMILTDPTGVILQSEGDAATLEAALDIRLTAGANWNESMSGTNAIGTALSVGGPVRVHGAEHFCAGIKPWSCSATAVRDPASGELLGVWTFQGCARVSIAIGWRWQCRRRPASKSGCRASTPSCGTAFWSGGLETCPGQRMEVSSSTTAEVA